MNRLTTILATTALAAFTQPSWAILIDGTDVGGLDNLLEQKELDNSGNAEIAFIQQHLGVGAEILPQIDTVSYLASSDTPNVYGFELNPAGDEHPARSRHGRRTAGRCSAAPY